ncbi:hypothetical protein CM19_08445 [Candidatus Acidianus copahuensis]|uniref:FAD linked oxidase N-terminal domain-containing protein n=1 Tax=Candidatus Acidianus copahuensis TaxID=1160895 RepID=A0A031LNL4_9CREN|nr:hypothetical protein CM19_08445 [Candidatus Acidianus copahuensis]
MDVYTESELFNEIRDAYLSRRKVAILGYGRHSKKGTEEEIIHIKMEDFTLDKGKVIAEAGASVEEIRKVASEEGLLLPSFYNGSVGGLLANNDLSPLFTHYGSAREFTDWVIFMTPYRAIKWKGVIGSKGKIGAITKAQFSLFPKPDRVFMLERKVDPNNLVKEVTELLKLKPLALLIDYDGSFYIHASFSEKIERNGYSIDEGVPNVEESNKNSFIVKLNSLEDFISLVDKSEPVYAYTIVDSKLAKIYIADESSLLGFNYYKADEPQLVFNKLKIIFDRNNIFI